MALVAVWCGVALVAVQRRDLMECSTSGNTVSHCDSLRFLEANNVFPYNSIILFTRTISLRVARCCPASSNSETYLGIDIHALPLIRWMFPYLNENLDEKDFRVFHAIFPCC